MGSRYGWYLVVGASVLMGMGAGALISVATFLKPIAADFGWLRGETSFGYMAGTLAMGGGGIVTGYLSDRFSTRPVVLIGMLCLGGSLMLLACVGNWFECNKGLALGQGLVPFAAGYMIAESGWREAYTTLGIVCLVGLLPLRSWCDLRPV